MKAAVPQNNKKYLEKSSKHREMEMQLRETNTHLL